MNTIYTYQSKDRRLTLSGEHVMNRFGDREMRLWIRLGIIGEKSFSNAHDEIVVRIPLADAKIDCHDILFSCFSESVIYGSFPPSGAFIVCIRKDPKYRNPYVIKIDTGVGEQMPDKTVKMIRVEDTLTILLAERDIRKMAISVLDYIQHWETYCRHFIIEADER